MFFKFPNEEEWNDLEGSYPFEKLEIRDDDFKYAFENANTVLKWSATSEIETWKNHLINRLIQTRWSFVFLMFHFNKGIPDKEWLMSPGPEGESIRYFPHFTTDDHKVKAQFDFYVDIFYYKLFSAWDTIGHLLNMMYELRIERSSFSKAAQALQSVNPVLHQELAAIIESDHFRTMQDFRHTITHNHLPGHIGSSVRRISDNEMTFGGGSYTPSAKIQANIIQALNLFAKTLKVIREHQITSTIDPVLL